MRGSKSGFLNWLRTDRKRMTLGERILLSLSRSPGSKDYDCEDWTIDNALSLLEREFPSFSSLVYGKKILDFGCGSGFQSIALAKFYGCTVTGIDNNLSVLARAGKRAAHYTIPPSRLTFVSEISESMLNSFDVVISQNSFEHLNNPAETLYQMTNLIHRSGKILITFGPPWLAPYGSHMFFFCKLPWVNVLFSEKTVMNVRSHYRDDGARSYRPGLNKMTIAKLERLLAESELVTEFKTYRCVKGINLLSRLPGLREFFINVVTLILARKPQI